MIRGDTLTEAQTYLEIVSIHKKKGIRCPGSPAREYLWILNLSTFCSDQLALNMQRFKFMSTFLHVSDMCRHAIMHSKVYNANVDKAQEGAKIPHTLSLFTFRAIPPRQTWCSVTKRSTCKQETMTHYKCTCGSWSILKLQPQSLFESITFQGKWE